MLSIAAPFSRTAVFPQGDVKIKDVAGLYIYDNTLEAVVLTGAEVRAYLEFSARYFVTLAPGAPVDPATISDPAVPDYNYDVFSGVDYDIDISRPVGSRITRLQIGGADVAADARFVVAVNNYRRSGGQRPRHRQGAGLQRPAGDPAVADRLGAGEGRDRPGRLLRPELAARPRRGAGLPGLTRETQKETWRTPPRRRVRHEPPTSAGPATSSRRRPR